MYRKQEAGEERIMIITSTQRVWDFVRAFPHAIILGMLLQCQATFLVYRSSMFQDEREKRR